MMMTSMVERIALLAEMLDEPMQEKLWEYAELLYVEQTVFEDTMPEAGRGELAAFGESLSAAHYPVVPHPAP